jgi:hypothetical protein
VVTTPGAEATAPGVDATTPGVKAIAPGVDVTTPGVKAIARTACLGEDLCGARV